MRRDTQIGIILGIVILVIIGVFLSTRASNNISVLPDLVLSEGVRQKTEVKEIDINSFFKESKKAEPEKELAVEFPTEEVLVSEELVELTQPEMQPEATIVETSIDEESSLEGKWEGVAKVIVEEPEIAEQVVEDVHVVQNTPSVEEIVVPEPEEEPHTSSYTASAEPVYYKVQSNDNLFKIAKKHYGDGQKWRKIFEANRDIMPDSNSLYIDQLLLIPDVSVENRPKESFITQVRGRLDNERSKNVDTHTVKAGDTLYRIAEEYYDDPNVWTKILEANKNTLEDAGSLKKGQVLIIPNL